MLHHSFETNDSQLGSDFVIQGTFAKVQRPFWLSQLKGGGTPTPQNKE